MLQQKNHIVNCDIAIQVIKSTETRDKVPYYSIALCEKNLHGKKFTTCQGRSL